MSFFRSFFIRVFLIFCLLFFVGTNYSFVNAANTPTQDVVQDTINSYILEIYKFQGNKIIEDLEVSFTKIAPTAAARIEAYTSIQETLRHKSASISDDPTIGKNSKLILTKYLDYMIDGIEKKKLLLQ